MALDASGALYVAGWFSQTVDFDPSSGTDQMTSSGDMDGFIWRLSSEGNHLGCQQIGGANANNADRIALRGNDPVYVSGRFVGTAVFPSGESLQSNAGSTDSFVYKCNPPQGGGSGSISGNVFADIDGDTLNDDGIATPPGTIVYCDVDNDTVRDANEPKAITQGPSGAYTIAGLDYNNGSGGSVTYVVRQDALPAGGGPQSVTLSAASKNATGVNFGNDFTTEAKSYENKTKYTIKDNSVVSSKITVADSYSIPDLNVTVNITYSNRADLKVELIAPDGTTILLANTGAYPAAITPFDDEGTYRPAQALSTLDLKNIQGLWTLRVTDSVKNRKTGTLNSWSLTAIKEVPPVRSAGTLADAALASLATPQRKSSSAPAPWTPELADLALMGMVAEA